MVANGMSEELIKVYQENVNKTAKEELDKASGTLTVDKKAQISVEITKAESDKIITEEEYDAITQRFGQRAADAIVTMFATREYHRIIERSDNEKKLLDKLKQKHNDQ